jgi:hypothetical protein
MKGGRTAEDREMAARRRWSLAILVVTLACAASAIAGPVSQGVWGGPEGNLTVYADSATLDLPCAAGLIKQAVVAGSDGTFDVPGLYAPQVGPVQAGGPLWQPARFQGSHTGGDITLTIVLSDSVNFGPLTFHQGTVGTFPRCL